MALLTIKAEKNKELLEYIKSIKTNLKDSNYIRNPFIGYIKTFSDIEEENTIIVLKMTPIYFNFPLLLLVTGLCTLVVFGLHWYSILQLCIGSLSIIWTPQFFYMGFKMGAKKFNYKGELFLISHKEAIEYLVSSLYKKG